MKQKALVLLVASTIIVFYSVMLQSCKSNNKEGDHETSISEMRDLEGQDLVNRGAYLVTLAGCNDCHTPKVMGPKGPADDTTRLLSGHPSTIPLGAFSASALKPGGYVMVGPDLTTWIGPWGISYPANLTPDSTSGLGAWDDETFIRTLRTGKHLGQPNGRDILPPMPWFNYAKATDEDLKAIFAYLKSLPPIKNKVPAPLSPDEAMTMAKD